MVIIHGYRYTRTLPVVLAHGYYLTRIIPVRGKVAGYTRVPSRVHFKDQFYICVMLGLRWLVEDPPTPTHLPIGACD